ncbi:MAG: Crp/Fnr family transcriptional regulator [Rubrimonas sp.]|uniref:Crp/Fnr family transcriptional regulator n=1 Tax=Rubrimonas sp. TaxID=2036015 RepID=UPI002FDCADE6
MRPPTSQRRSPASPGAGVETALATVAPGFSPTLRARLAANGRRIAAPDGARLFGPGDSCEGFTIPLRGAVRVEHMSESGRSVVLYRVGPGDSCVMTTSCLLSGAPYAAYGYAEGDVSALTLAAEQFRALVEESPEFRGLALSVFSSRIVELVEVIDELLLRRVDVKLAGWLAAQPYLQVRATHQAIAAELGTAREVVSRLLKEFERRGWIALGRGEIALRDRPALAAFAGTRA